MLGGDWGVWVEWGGGGGGGGVEYPLGGTDCCRHPRAHGSGRCGWGVGGAGRPWGVLTAADTLVPMGVGGVGREWGV